MDAVEGLLIVNTAVDTIAGGIPDEIRADNLARYDGNRSVTGDGPMAGLIPTAQIRIYADAAHGSLFEYPTEVAAEVNAFLGSEEGTVPA